MSRALVVGATLRRVSAAPRRAVAVATLAVRHLSTDDHKVVKEMVDDKVKSVAAVVDVQHKNFKEAMGGFKDSIGSMPDKITGRMRTDLGAVEKKFEGKVDSVKESLGNVEKTLKTDIAAVKETLKTEVAEKTSSLEKSLKADVSATEKSLKADVSAAKDAMTERTAAVEKTLLAKLDAVGSKFDFVEKVLLRVGWGMVAAVGGSIAYAIFRPVADAMVEKKVHEIRAPPTATTATAKQATQGWFAGSK